MEIAQGAINKPLDSLDIKEDLYKAVIQNALEGFVILSLKGDILDANEAFSRMNGYSRDELLSMRIYDLSPQQMTADGYAQFIKDHAKQGGANFETRHRCKDGSIINVKVSSKYLDTDGGVFFSFHSDITEHKKRERQKEKSLKETEDRYRTLIELGTKIGEAVIMLQDIDGREGMHTYVSDQWPNITGYSKEELLSISLFDIISPEDSESAVDRHRQKMSGKTIPSLIELSIIHKDGKEIPVEITSAATVYKGKSANAVYIRDITARKRVEKELKKHQQRLEKLVRERTSRLEQKISKLKQTEIALRESEERYRSLFNNVPVGIFEVDFSEARKYFLKSVDNDVKNIDDYFNKNQLEFFKCMELVRIIDINKALIDIYEAKNKNEVRLFFEKTVIKEKSFYNSYMHIFHLIAEGAPGISYEEYTKTFIGNWRNQLINILPAPGCEKTFARVFISVMDITNLKSIENKLHESYESEKLLRIRLEQEIKHRMDFTRLLVHELRTPLTPLLGASELLARELKDERLIDTAKTIYNGALKLENRVNELLDQAKLETGSLELKREITDANKLLNEIVEYVKPRLAKKAQLITLDIMNPLPLLFADGERLNQIILNLVDNSFKNTPIGGKIIIRAYKDRGYLVFEIEDNGYGIAKINQKSLFKPYSQLHNNGNNMGGLGLGLSYVKSGGNFTVAKSG